MLARAVSILAVLLGVGIACPVAAAPQSAGPAAAADTTDGAVDAPASSVLSDPFVRTKGKEGLNLLYDMKFEQARSIFSRIDSLYPDHPVGPFLKGLNVWWKIMVDLSSTDHDEAFVEAMDEVIARSDAILEEDPDNFDATFFKGAALGFRGRLRSNRGRWIKALMDGKRAIGYVREVASQAPENDDYLFGKGLYDYYAAIIPEQYPVSKAVTWMMPDGDRDRGLRLLEQTARDGWYVQTEAVYFLAQIYYLYEENYSQTRYYLDWLRRRHPNNPYFHVFDGRARARFGHWDQAARIFREVAARCENGRPGYTDHMAQVAHFYLARGRIYDREFEDAIGHLAELERLSTAEDEPGQFRVLGYLYQGMAYDGLDRRDMAVSRYHRVLNLPDHHGAHERARKYLEDPYGS